MICFFWAKSRTGGELWNLISLEPLSLQYAWTLCRRPSITPFRTWWLTRQAVVGLFLIICHATRASSWVKWLYMAKVNLHLLERPACKDHHDTEMLAPFMLNKVKRLKSSFLLCCWGILIQKLIWTLLNEWWKQH